MYLMQCVPPSLESARWLSTAPSLTPLNPACAQTAYSGAALGSDGSWSQLTWAHSTASPECSAQLKASVFQRLVLQPEPQGAAVTHLRQHLALFQRHKCMESLREPEIWKNSIWN